VDGEQEQEPFELEITWGELQEMVRRAYVGEDPEMLFLEYFVNHVITDD
jgi:hypothetical protein